MTGKITKVIDEVGNITYKVTQTTESVETFRLEDLEIQIKNLQDMITNLENQKAAFEKPDTTVDLRPDSAKI